jgi:hypothetical protein
MVQSGWETNPIELRLRMNKNPLLPVSSNFWILSVDVMENSNSLEDPHVLPPQPETSRSPRIARLVMLSTSTGLVGATILLTLMRFKAGPLLSFFSGALWPLVTFLAMAQGLKGASSKHWSDNAKRSVRSSGLRGQPTDAARPLPKD